MKLRSLLLLTCMAVVPLLAMFSHKIPRDWRLAVQRLARGEGFSAPRAPSVQPPAAPPSHADQPQLAEPSGLATAAPPSVRTPPEAAAASGMRAAVEDQLAALGAVSIECVPLAGGGMHRCSCRVPADPTGQLQRLFQTSHPDPAVAMKTLLGQVQFWKHRLAARPEAANPLRASHGAREPGPP